MLFAEVAVTVPLRGNKTFHYRVPQALVDEIKQFSRVEVPFSGRLIQGFVLSFSEPPEVHSLKDIGKVIEKEPLLNMELYELAQWMSNRYLCSLGDALQCIAGPASPGKVLQQECLLAEVTEEQLAALSRAPKQKQALETALYCPGLTKGELAKQSGVTLTVINTLLEKGLLKITNVETCTNNITLGTSKVPVLTGEQVLVFNKVKELLEKDKPSAMLLHGVTGSGKTEIYLRAIEATLARGRQAIVLVPEISLTPQMVNRFTERFGKAVAVLHSGMSNGERKQEKWRIKIGQAPVILGARSAIFAPASNLGLIIIDEEHEQSYKQDETPKYHAREVALKRAALKNAVVLLGSATPAVESYCRARVDGPYELAVMRKRVDDRMLPGVEVVDLRQEMALGNVGIFSRALANALAQRLARGEKSILFLNRRGFATVVLCRQCGQVIKCPRCDISLTLHNDRWLRCHYCGFSSKTPVSCPGCGSKYIRGFGVGTQRVEEEVKGLFPDCSVLRMDADTTTRKGSHKRILDQFIDGHGQVLIGTQMIAKGLDIPQVTLVGVISADVSLHLPDFRASERTFQLLTQVAGRAGRGVVPGQVIIQTYDPGHFAIVMAKNHDFMGFYNREMSVRKALNYPPFSHLIRILFTAVNEADVISAAQWWQQNLNQAKEKLKVQAVDILGPAPAGIPRIKDRYRWQLIIKGTVSTEIRKIAAEVLERAGIRFKTVKVSIDVDPLSI